MITGFNWLSEINNANNNLWIYINSEANKDATVSLTQNTEQILIGHNFNGKIDEVMIFNYSLADGPKNSEIKSLYNNFKKI